MQKELAFGAIYLYDNDFRNESGWLKWSHYGGSLFSVKNHILFLEGTSNRQSLKGWVSGYVKIYNSMHISTSATRAVRASEYVLKQVNVS